ncbi:MAG: glutamate-5-semialdehyde dehydrogenase [Candidatus Omnitrophica bacterium]|nr:glutamate-5-semialdehyde dehydrogenase [Candidatus Omnitrophota bacterium]
MAGEIRFTRYGRHETPIGYAEVTIHKICVQAKQAASTLALLDSRVKVRLLLKMARALERDWRAIRRSNEKDLRKAGRFGLTAAMKDRLYLDHGRIEEMAEAVRTVAHLKDPVGRVLKRWRRPSGLWIEKVSVPLGVILIIYESRPNVTADCASLCLKSGNAVILRGGREAVETNRAIVDALRKPLASFNLPPASIGFVKTRAYSAVNLLLKETENVSLVIPRGGEALIRKIAALSRIPVIKHYRGNCHVYIDRDADIGKAVAIAYNAKVQRPGVCNAMETLLVHRRIAPVVLPRLGKLFLEAGVELRGCPVTRRILPGIKEAREQDWYEEYLDLILAVRVVPSLDEAVRHITRYGSQHSDAIVTRNKRAAELFVHAVDSASVFVNASTRLADGGVYGFGAEVGISTDKFHARGPMGIEDLTSYKYVVRGTGQIRE